MAVLEGLESYPQETEQWKSHLRKLYLLSMGNYKMQGEKQKEEDDAKNLSAEKATTKANTDDAVNSEEK